MRFILSLHHCRRHRESMHAFRSTLVAFCGNVIGEENHKKAYLKLFEEQITRYALYKGIQVAAKVRKCKKRLLYVAFNIAR